MSHVFRDKCVFEFHTEIQDGRQTCQENYFWEKSPVDSADTVGVKNFIKIALPSTVSEIKVCLHFTQKFKMAAKHVRKTIFGKSYQSTLQIPWGLKISSNCSISQFLR